MLASSFLATVLPRLSTFAALLLFSRWLTPVEFGLFALCIAVGEFIDSTAVNWLRVGILRFYHGGLLEQHGRPSLTPGLSATLVGLAGALPLAWLASVLVSGNEHPLAPLAVTVYLVNNWAVSMIVVICRGEGRFREQAIFEAVRAPASLLVGAYVLTQVSATHLAAALAMFGTSSLLAVPWLARLWVARHEGAHTALPLGDIIAYGLPLVPCFAAAALITYADRYVVQLTLGPSAVAIYSAAYAIGRQPLEVLSNSVNVMAFSRLMEAYDRGGDREAAQVLRVTAALLSMLLLPAAAGVISLRHELSAVLFDERYQSLAPGLIPPAVFIALANGYRAFVFDQVFHMKKAPIRVLNGILPGAIAAIVASVVAGSQAWLQGAAYGAMAGAILAAVVNFRLSRQLLSFELPWADLGRIAASAAVMAITISAIKAACTLAVGYLIALGMAVFLGCVLVLCRSGVRSVEALLARQGASL